MKIYCRDCGALVVEDADLMGTEIFKQKYGETGPSCGSPFSDYFNVKQPIIVNKTKRTL